ncbi:winged helix-turn-helix domain-containing protein [uncultured Pseudonocardia sp.]|jgi:DNA-binding response OmpR family regulator|uniref:winged helix-turn-helix domain-containing protein n=1 Tax=uncultured Pseudonocardia sp. TaxID=211455 RepID=UPI0026119F84|nr:winged helix-turn-helix domain-containing protein [uncultured Pseudonocardia sp.]
MVLEAGGATFDIARSRVLVEGYVVHVPAREAPLLAALMQHPGQVISCVELQLAADDTARYSVPVDRLVRRLRRRLQASPLSPPRIHRVGAAGYVFSIDPR